MFGFACAPCWSPAAGLALVALLFLLLAALLLGSAWLVWVKLDAHATAGGGRGANSNAPAAQAAAAGAPSSRTASIALRLLLTHVQFLGAMQAFKSSSLVQFREATGWTSTVSASPFSLGPELVIAYALVAAMRKPRWHRAVGTRSECAGVRCRLDSRAWLAAMREWLHAGKHISATVAVMSLAYMPIVTAALTALDCTDTAIDGVGYLQADLSVACYTGQHAVARAAAVAQGAVGIGFPALLAARLWRASPKQLPRELPRCLCRPR
jgi:hypothetical protein